MALLQPLLELARAILVNAEILDQYITSNRLPQPSFDVNAPPAIPPIRDSSARAAHEKLLIATRDLHALALGPGGFVRELSMPEDLFSLAVINHFSIAKHVPIDGEASFEDIADRTGIPEADVARIMRHAMTNYLFSEPRPGLVTHTACSRLLAENALVRGMVTMGCGERFLAAAKHVEALELHPASEEPALSVCSFYKHAKSPVRLLTRSPQGWGLANNARAPMFEELALRHPERAATVAQTMTALASLKRADAAADLYEWATLGKAQVVDIGGGKGQVSIALSQRFPDLFFTVQDLPAVVASGKAALPLELAGRVKFMEHDFFDEQPMRGADVYFFRSVLHDWPDKYCVRILRALIPALKAGAKVLLIEPFMPEAGTMTRWEERNARSADLRMMIFLNGRDREVKDWAALFSHADPRYRFNGMNLSPSTSVAIGRASLAVFEATWEG